MVRFIQTLCLLNMNGMVLDMLKINIQIKNTKELDSTLNKLKVRYGKKGRNIIRSITQNLELNLKNEMTNHDVLGITSSSIKMIPGKGTSFNRKVEFSEVMLYLEKGTRPHAIPDGRAELYADKYGMSAKQFWYNIYKNGTRKYPVITNAIMKTERNVPNIIRNEISKK